VRGRRQQQGRSTKRCGKHGLRRAVRKTDEVAPALLAAAGLWSHLASFEVVVRFLVTASAMVVMFQAFRARNYAVAVVFGAIALFYNPVAPAFSFSGDWQRAVVAASAVLFVASLAWPTRRIARTEHND